MNFFPSQASSKSEMGWLLVIITKLGQKVLTKMYSLLRLVGRGQVHRALKAMSRSLDSFRSAMQNL